MLVRQQEVMAGIAKEKDQLRPYLDQWEGLRADTRAQLRAGRAGEIMAALETVAEGIQARHAEMFGADESAVARGGSGGQAGAPNGPAGAKPPGGDGAKPDPQAPDLSQMINIYRAMQ